MDVEVVVGDSVVVVDVEVVVAGSVVVVDVGVVVVVGGSVAGARSWGVCVVVVGGCVVVVGGCVVVVGGCVVVVWGVRGRGARGRGRWLRGRGRWLRGRGRWLRGRGRRGSAGRRRCRARGGRGGLVCRSGSCADEAQQARAGEHIQLREAATDRVCRGEDRERCRAPDLRQRGEVDGVGGIGFEGELGAVEGERLGDRCRPAIDSHQDEAKQFATGSEEQLGERRRAVGIRRDGLHCCGDVLERVRGEVGLVASEGIQGAAGIDALVLPCLCRAGTSADPTPSGKYRASSSSLRFGTDR